MKNKKIFRLLVCVIFAYGFVSTKLIAELSLEQAVLNNAKEVETEKLAEEVALNNAKEVETEKLAEEVVLNNAKEVETEKLSKETETTKLSKETETTKLAEETQVGTVKSIEAINPEIEQMMTKEQLYRNKLELQIVDLMNESLKRKNNRAFESATLPILEAFNILKDSKVGNKADNKFLNDKLAAIYVDWAEFLNLGGYDLEDTSKFKDAIAKADKALEINPNLEKWYKSFIKDCDNRKDIVAYKKQTSGLVVDPNKISREYEEKLNVLRGNILLKNRKFVLARKEYEQTLIINPTNPRAIEGIRQCNLALRKYGNMRKKVTIRERVVEEQWKHVQPIKIKVKKITSQISTGVISKSESSFGIQSKLDSIIFDTIEFDDVAIDLVIPFIRQRAKALDPLKVGVNLLLKLTGEERPPVTMIVSNVSLREAIRNICLAVPTLKYRIEKHAVIIASKDVPLDDVETRIYPLEQDSLSGIDGTQSEQLKEYFTKRGIDFPANAAIVYDNAISRLIVTNTPANLDMVEAVVRQINVIDPQVLIETKFVEISHNDLEELGFQS